MGESAAAQETGAAQDAAAANESGDASLQEEAAQEMGPLQDAAAIDGGDASLQNDAAPDAGLSGGDAAPIYGNLTDPSQWAAFDTKKVTAVIQSFLGAAFDGRYVYLVPSVADHPTVTRYDSQASFTDATSWSTFDTLTLGGIGPGEAFAGAAFDGRYVYFVPHTTDNAFLRYDSRAPFTDVGSWSTFVAPGTLDVTYAGAAFDGRYVYFAPNVTVANLDGTVARYDTTQAFASASSWLTFSTNLLANTAGGFTGALFDGRYVYFVPTFVHSRITRYDTTASFADSASWGIFDPAGDGFASEFFGGAFDGRYMYLAPQQPAAARFDTQGPFASDASWSSFDVPQSDASVPGFSGGAFDGRYVYFVPSFTTIVRVDTTALFTAPTSWSTYDVAAAVPQFAGFAGAAFDGRYLYFVPSRGGVVLRFDAKQPASVPRLPGFAGSFL